MSEQDDGGTPPARIDGHLVAGGKYHDIDYARSRLLDLLAEHPQVRMTVSTDYEAIDTVTGGSFLVSYTCDTRPSEEAQTAVADWVAGGGRWLALHGTNSALDLGGPNGVESPRCFPRWAALVGSQFVAHPPIHAYPVEVTDSSHWLVEGIETFETDDELYVMEYPDEAALVPLLHTMWEGEATGFAESDWSDPDGPTRHLVQYLRSYGEGEVLYNSLGHVRGHWDMAPLVDYYPRIERGAWDKDAYIELLRRGIRWAMGQNA
ncbi:MAG: ThuA domain-containing protein [Actinomycetota bacterium]